MVDTTRRGFLRGAASIAASASGASSAIGVASATAGAGIVATEAAPLIAAVAQGAAPVVPTAFEGINVLKMLQLMYQNGPIADTYEAFGRYSQGLDCLESAHPEPKALAEALFYLRRKGLVEFSDDTPSPTVREFLQREMQLAGLVLNHELPNADWQQHEFISGPNARIEQFFKLLQRLDISPDSEMSLDELSDKVVAYGQPRVQQALRHLLQHNPDLLTAAAKSDTFYKSYVVDDVQSILGNRLSKKTTPLHKAWRALAEQTGFAPSVFSIEERCIRACDPQGSKHFAIHRKEGNETFDPEKLGLREGQYQLGPDGLTLPANTEMAKRLSYWAYEKSQFTYADLKKPLPQVEQVQHEQSLNTSAGILSFGA